MAARLFNWKMPDPEWDLLEREVKTGLAPNKSVRIRRLLAAGRAHEAACADGQGSAEPVVIDGPCPRCAHLKDWQLAARAQIPEPEPEPELVEVLSAEGDNPWSEGSWA